MGPHEQLIQALKDLLHEFSVSEIRRCPGCQRLMEHVIVTFELEGESWDIPLPFCPHCTAAMPPSRVA